MEQLPFTQEFVLAMALDWASPEQICREHGVSEEEYSRLLSFKPFQTALSEMRKVLSEQGVTAAFKAKVAVESLIGDVYSLASDGELNPQIRLAAFQQLLKLSGLDKPEGQAMEGFTLQIVMGDSGPQPLVAVSVGPARNEPPKATALPGNDVFEVDVDD